MEISRPPFHTSNFISLLPASREFSINSLIILVGFSTTSPAAIALETLSSKILIRFISTSSIKYIILQYNIVNKDLQGKNNKMAK